VTLKYPTAIQKTSLPALRSITVIEDSGKFQEKFDKAMHHAMINQSGILVNSVQNAIYKMMNSNFQPRNGGLCSLPACHWGHHRHLGVSLVRHPATFLPRPWRCLKRWWHLPARGSKHKIKECCWHRRINPGCTLYTSGNCWHFLCLIELWIPQAHRITTVALHLGVFQGIIIFLREARRGKEYRESNDKLYKGYQPTNLVGVSLIW